MKFNRILLPGVIVLAVLFLSYPAIPQTSRDVIVRNVVQTKPVPGEIISLRDLPAGRDVCSTGRGFLQTLPDGSDPARLTPFVIPAGKVLIITSLQWKGAGLEPNSLTWLSLHREREGIPRRSTTLTWPGLAAQAPAMSDRFGRAGGYLTIPNGLLVKSGAYLCAGLYVAQSGKSAVPDVTMQGYLAEDFVITRTPIPRGILQPPTTNKGGISQPAPKGK